MCLQMPFARKGLCLVPHSTSLFMGNGMQIKFSMLQIHNCRIWRRMFGPFSILAHARSSGKSLLLLYQQFLLQLGKISEHGTECMKNSLKYSSNFMVCVYQKSFTKRMCCSQRPRDLTALYHCSATFNSAV